MPEVKHLTDLQKMQVVYAYFTLEEWKILASCLRHSEGAIHGGDTLTDTKMNNILVKMPCACCSVL